MNSLFLLSPPHYGYGNRKEGSLFLSAGGYLYTKMGRCTLLYDQDNQEQDTV